MEFLNLSKAEESSWLHNGTNEEAHEGKTKRNKHME
jgi:hypothetical protein